MLGRQALAVCLLLFGFLGSGVGPLAAGEVFVYVTNFSTHNVSVIEASTSSVVATIPVGTGPGWVAVAPDGSRAYVSNMGSNSVSVIDTSTNTVVATIPAGITPAGIVVSPDGSRVYVANELSNSVSVVDTAAGTVIATVPVGALPVGIGQDAADPR